MFLVILLQSPSRKPKRIREILRRLKRPGYLISITFQHDTPMDCQAEFHTKFLMKMMERKRWVWHQKL